VNSRLHLLAVLLICVPAHAETLRDPTLPLQDNNIFSDVPKPEPQDPAPSLQLQGIILGFDEKLAIINSTRLRTGDLIAGHHVEDIAPRKVILVKDGQHLTLNLRFSSAD